MCFVGINEKAPPWVALAIDGLCFGAFWRRAPRAYVPRDTMFSWCHRDDSPDWALPISMGALGGAELGLETTAERSGAR